MALRDLGLTYEQAAHGVQSAIKFELERSDRNNLDHFKHMRTGLDCRAADAQGLAALLISKGVFTEQEYIEYMRLAMNEELVRYEQHIQQEFNLTISFR